MSESSCVDLYFVSYTVSEKKVGSISAQDVGQFLKDIKLEVYTELFIAKDIDGETLNALDEKDLEEIGVKLGYERKKILTKFKNYMQTI